MVAFSTVCLKKYISFNSLMFVTYTLHSYLL